MNSINCPECNNICDSKDEMCSKCGYPIKAHYMNQANSELVNHEQQLGEGEIKCPECGNICSTIVYFYDKETGRRLTSIPVTVNFMEYYKNIVLSYTNTIEFGMREKNQLEDGIIL